MRIFPIRHHSPAAALQLEALMREMRPATVLIEGPPEADELIDLLLDPETVPPVALYAYRTGEHVESVFYPFCSYSPEYVALRIGRELGAEVRFCDLAARTTLSLQRVPAMIDLTDEPTPNHGQALAAAAGFDDFEAFWEAAFEQDAGADGPDQLAAALAVYGAELRALEPPERLLASERRERHMAAVARLADCPDDRLLLVCGAFHVDGIAHFYREERGAPEVSDNEPATMALIPFSFPRLSEQSGYGAGNRAPWFYEQVWRAGGDFLVATRLGLLALQRHLRTEGRLASLAQAIDGEVLARHLAAMRGKRAPGVDELYDAAVACFSAGEPEVVRRALHRVLIGETVGRLSPRVGRTPLQSEFYARLQQLRLPIQDLPTELLVHLPVPAEAERSVLLHRLVVAGVSYGRELQAGLGGRGQDAAGGALGSLGRALEKWQVQWTPSTDAQLIERSAWGSTFEEVCGRLLRDQLDAATRIDEGTGVLLRMALCALPEGFDSALARCEQLGGDSASFPALAQATYQLDGLLGYGAARALPVERITTLVQRLFTRAVVHLPEASRCGDETAQEIHARLVALNELVQRGSRAVADPAPFWEAVERVATEPASHATMRGLALLLLELGQRLPPGELARRLHYWLGAANAPADAARLIAALFSLHRATLLRNRELIGAVTSFLRSMPMDELLALLPILRGSLGNLADRERDHLAATLAALFEVGGATATAELSLTADVIAAVQAQDAAVAETLRRWETQYGLA